ncbi:hypothetical protein K2Y11_17795 [bacterium]|nr:hypothetical protein [bacterium]
MPAEFWVYGGLMVAAGLLVWRIAMQYYTYLEDAYNHSEMTRNQLRAYLRGNDSVTGGPTDGGDVPPKSPAPAVTASKSK